jgi:hypothetical protein
MVESIIGFSAVFRLRLYLLLLFRYGKGKVYKPPCLISMMIDYYELFRTILGRNFPKVCGRCNTLYENERDFLSRTEECPAGLVTLDNEDLDCNTFSWRLCQGRYNSKTCNSSLILELKDLTSIEEIIVRDLLERMAVSANRKKVKPEELMTRFNRAYNERVLDINTKDSNSSQLSLLQDLI